MRFEVRYPSGAAHEVELEGTLAVVGRDPGCDLVLNDTKCSRRHAVLEAGAQGIAIRDTGSANGVYVNGKKVERAALDEGDIVQLGEVFLKVLPEDLPRTLVMNEQEALELGHQERSAPPPPASPPGRATIPVPSPPPAAPAAPPPRPALPVEQARPALRPPTPRGPLVPQPPRPLTVTVLAVLWWAGILVYLALAVGALFLWPATAAVPGWSVAAFGVIAALVSGLMGTGLFQCRPWARILQIALAALAAFTCVFAPACVAIVIYMLRADARRVFAHRPRVRSPDKEPQIPPDSSTEMAFSGTILGCVALGMMLLAVVLFVAGRFR